MDRLDNPAGRLLALVEKGLEIGQLDAPIRDTWRAVLQAEDDDVVYLRRYGAMLALPDEIRSLVWSLDVNTDLYLRWLPNIQSVFEQSSRQRWSKAVEGLQPTVTYLEFTADHLSRTMPEVIVPDEHLVDIRSKVRSVLDEVTGATDIGPELRRVLARLLMAMIHAIDDVDIRGAKGLRASVELTVGGTILYKTETASVSEKQTSLIRKVIGAAAMLATVVGLANSSAELSRTVHNALNPGPATSDETSSVP